MANQRNGTLYIGVTGDITRRVHEHKEGLFEGFTKKYGLKLLVYYEVFDSIEAAIQREKAMKKWNRNWKLRQIIDFNPDWNDLSLQLNQ